MNTKPDDSEYLAAWKEMDEAEKPKAVEPKNDGFMGKLSTIGKALLTSDTPRTSTIGASR